MNDYNERSIWLRMRALLSLNDPRWGRGDGNGDRQRPNDPKRPGRDGEGPPDLDEMWRDFNRRLSRIFGRKGGGGVGGGGRPDNGRGARIGVGIVIGVLIAIYLGSGVFVVQDGQAAVVLQFGKYRYTAAQGVHWRLPYPFESHEFVNVGQIRQVEIGRSNVVRLANVKDASMLTHDGDIVDVRFAVQYQVRKPNDFLFRSVDPDQSVMHAAQAAVRGIVGAHSTSDILDQDHETLRQQLIASIQQSLDQYQSGLGVTGVTIQSVQVPEQVQPAFADAAKVHDENERLKRDAQAYAADLVPRAQADVDRQVQEAKTYSQTVVAQAQAEAERFKQVYAQYAKAPALVRFRLYMETMQQIYANATKVFVDAKNGNNVLYLPLDRLVEQNRERQAAAAGAAASGPAVAGAPQAASAAAPSAASAAETGAAAGSAAEGASGPAASAPAPASRPSAASLRSREAFRNRMREEDVQ
ncbi:FtsH protease activity modulator HflK [Paraburkholderia sp. CNPSo 3155]|uniref:Protein HflK n=1 Tax=Paraburkholderia atlantica TaxID=2654982 RepID=A0A6I1PZ42_PARAM|nr:FtsH protease activity modulator HflK [Paraburkholderia atlantica]MBB5425236.1 membrane protease subunit HflK [Paraburkholderia atlantica]MPW04700.1 FtsH protease activity modulator HflK [Paraburkholderia atlantica]NUY32009.1 FtsH protease activity modulator HflK [Paraburkholderia atlantica]